MKKIFTLVVIGMAFTMIMSGLAQAQDKMATPAQAKELHKKIVAYAKEVGCEKAIAEFNNTKSSFNATYKNAYSTMGDPSGITVANGRYPFIVGQNHMDVKDAEGKPFIKIGWEDLRKNGYTQHEYRWMDPKTKKIETRTLKSELVDCGAPRGKLSASITYEGKM